MKLGIVGGVLQGMEAVYLAKKAGYETVVFDRWDEAPALPLADEAVIMDVTKERDRAARLFADCDAILPANEDIATLTCLDSMFRKLEVPLLFDLHAYEISSSKLRSNQFMEGLGVALPGAWPTCGFPVVVKPSGQSGSMGVTRADSEEELTAGVQRVHDMGDEAIVQEFVEGPNISIEVIGNGENAMPMVITEVVLDDAYDCRMVRCPVKDLDAGTADSFATMAKKLAEGLHLRGIMDVEAIVKDGIPKVLEIDARIPSQTPAAVYHATGINLVQRLVDAIVLDHLDDAPGRDEAAIYEHVAVDNGRIRTCGEGVFSQVRRPRIEPGLFGADDVITDFEPGKDSWRGAIMCSGHTLEEALDRRAGCWQEIARRCGTSEDMGVLR